MMNLDTEDGRIIAAALRLAEERPWGEIALRDIADAAATDLAGLRRHFDGKTAIVAAFMRKVDDEVLSQAPKPDPTQSPRDALFEVVMSRFDALQPHRNALRSISKDGIGDPALLPSVMASQAWMLEAAGIEADGIEGGIRVTGLAGLYASVFSTWLEDDDPGLARTMAVLDRRLRRAERTMSSVNMVTSACRGAMDFLRSGRRRRDDSETSSAAPDDGSAPVQEGTPV